MKKQKAIASKNNTLKINKWRSPALSEANSFVFKSPYVILSIYHQYVQDFAAKCLKTHAIF